MPIHDWTRVAPADYHHFHGRWIFALADYLNDGVMPDGYYAMAERSLRAMEPDVLAVEELEPANGNGTHASGGRLTSVVEAPPRVSFTAATEPVLAAGQWTLTARQPGSSRVAAVIEIVSPGNKGTRHAFQAFVGKAESLIRGGVHLSVLDLFPPTRRDPDGMHAAIWDAVGGEPYSPVPGRSLTLVAYAAGSPTRAFIEPTAVGRVLADLPWFLEPEFYVSLPLEQTYQEAWRTFPAQLRAVVEGK